MKAYSIDLRQKIIDIYNKGNLSQRQLTQQFGVALSFIQKLLKQYRQGNIAPKVRTKQTPLKFSAQELLVLQELVNNNNDPTLEELRHQLALKTGVLIGRSTVNRMLGRLNLTLKKNTARYGKRNRESTKATVRFRENS